VPKRSSDDIVWMANNISCIMHGVTFSKKERFGLRELSQD
jgi:hypothetical protein